MARSSAAAPTRSPAASSCGRRMARRSRSRPGASTTSSSIASAAGPVANDQAAGSAMTLDLSGKTVLVTGGNGGIGLGMAQGLAEAGADLIVWGSNAEKLARAREMLAAPGRRVLAQRCDVADESQVERAKGGDPGGRLVVVASTAAVHGAARAAAYAATKGALVAMTRALAVEMARHAVTANAILPGWIETEMTAGGIADPKFAANVLPRIPMRRWGEPRDFAGLAVYLASDASRYHTGDSFVVDGAYTIF